MAIIFDISQNPLHRKENVKDKPGVKQIFIPVRKLQTASAMIIKEFTETTLFLN